MKEENRREAVCPRCGRIYYEVPALSREDNETFICPDCGTREALASLGIDEEEQERILETMHGVISQYHSSDCKESG